MSSIIQHHLSEAFRLRLGAAVELHLVEFADAVYERGDLTAEFFFQPGNRCAGIFDDVVQDRGSDRLRVHVHVCERLRDGNGMRYIRLASAAGLALVCRGTEFVGFYDKFYLPARQVGLQRIDQAPQTPVTPR
jgi:hypothetical protein